MDAKPSAYVLEGFAVLAYVAEGGVMARVGQVVADPHRPLQELTPGPN